MSHPGDFWDDDLWMMNDYEPKPLFPPGSGVWGKPAKMGHPAETPYSHSIWVVEWWNTLSNIFFFLLPFIPLAIEDSYMFGGKLTFELRIAYVLMIAVGLGSTIQHMTMKWWSRWLDYATIAMMAGWLCYMQAWWAVGIPTLLWGVFWLTFAWIDHHLTLFKPPFGHAVWHIGAAFWLAGVLIDQPSVHQLEMM